MNVQVDFGLRTKRRPHAEVIQINKNVVVQSFFIIIYRIENNEKKTAEEKSKKRFQKRR